jgi:uncharacterized protein (TIGR00725 family)
LARFAKGAAGALFSPDGRQFDVGAHCFVATTQQGGSEALSAAQAVRLVIEQGARRLPVAVIGPNDASPEELGYAEQAGAAIAALGLPMICGGRGGCMEAASRGCSQAGGLTIGMLPASDWATANPYVAIPIASGLGEARNAIIASACFALIAVGGGHGTLSEMALGLKMGRLVAAMPPAMRVPGALDCENIEAAMEAVALRYLGYAA